MRGEWTIVVGEEVFVEAKDSFYNQFLKGWFYIGSVDPQKDRFTLRNDTTGCAYKMFRNKKGICCVIEHKYDQYGVSTWDERKNQYRFIFVPVDMYVKTSK
tara:strand:+ start:3278 stop:3580 length:303 start_codon:yes stop_codon:yes gene_type:complete